MGTPLPPPRLFRDDVARILGARVGRDVSAETVSRAIRHSRPADPAKGRPAGRYAHDPVPTPRYRGNVPYWEAGGDYPTLGDVVRAFEEWSDRHMRRMHRLTDVDEAARRAVCTVCGPVDVVQSAGTWRCALGRQEIQRNYRARRDQGGQQ